MRQPKSRTKYLPFPILIGLAVVVGAFACSPWTSVDAQAAPTDRQSVVIEGIRVSLLDARLLSRSDYQNTSGDAAEWRGGGFHFAFLAENRTDQPIPPVLGEIRVLLGKTLYNDVTNASSSKPFAPDVIIREPKKFLETSYGRLIASRNLPATQSTVPVVEEVLVRGDAISRDAAVVVEIEQGGTRLKGGPPPDHLRAEDIDYHWFRFQVSSLE